MNHAIQDSPAVLKSQAMLCAIMYAQDEVKAKSYMLPFWMTVTSVNGRNGFCRCNFGSSGNYAGNFHMSELGFYGGKQLEQHSVP
ncbi:hypothetical protein IFT47_17670 [Pseudomonas sp. CFBP 13711]|uniref:hypothetical protein n=1 Tax=unclassified Pseudomonas TaxID=196821 RepID=UPI001786037F|nr:MULTISPECIES: hypothetical protein [unclassified Pseudomonas]MBD8708461.1 hypothetical protein [Pseudomonas sp. CFBP 13711]MBD8713903.1 hypothetical protein [Pseudomonas sp. CFBP 13715]